MSSVATLCPFDLSRATNATTLSSPSQALCRVRIPGSGALSMYRNDPYRCSVLPSLQAVAAPFETHAQAAPRHNGSSGPLTSLPPAFHMASKTATRVKAEIARAATYTSSSNFNSQDAASAQPINAFNPVSAANGTLLPASEPFGWALVRLKHEVLLYIAPFPLEAGDHVVMQGDRGENIGQVQQVVTEQPAYPVHCSILRFATAADLAGLEEKRRREEAAKNFAQGVADALQLRIAITDTEFQSDGNKLTVYFSSRRMIDFRQLQRQLFKQYRCRIWLVNWLDVVKAA